MSASPSHLGTGHGMTFEVIEELDFWYGQCPEHGAVPLCDRLSTCDTSRPHCPQCGRRF